MLKYFVFIGRIAHYVIIDMDGLVEVEGIEPCVLLTRFAEKQVFIMFCCFLNFSRFFCSHYGIPLNVFTVILRNISSSDLDLAVSGGRGLLCPFNILSAVLSILSVTWFIVLFFSWIDIFLSIGEDIFPSLGFCIVSIWGRSIWGLFLLLEVLNYFLEMTEVEKIAI